MSERVVDSTTVAIPPPPRAAAEEDRGASVTGRRIGQLGFGAVAAAAALGFVLYAVSGGLKQSGKETDKAQQEKPSAPDIANNASADPAAQGRSDNPAPEGEGQGAADQGGAERGEDELARLREQRMSAAQAARERDRAERERRIAERLAQRRAREQAPVMVLSAAAPDRAGTGLRIASLGQDRRMAAQGGSDPAPPRPGGLAGQLAAADIVRVSAARLPRRHFTIEAGTQIPCTLQTAIDSTLSGLVSCVIPYDVRSATGQIVLLEKGTRVLGEYQGGIQQGEARVFVVWNRAVSPGGVAVTLASPGADSLGRSGVPGEVETFFWKRYGAALLLSLIGDGTTLALGAAAGAAQTLATPRTAASEALRADAGIRPRLRAAQGAALVIVAARDLDFSSVYSLRLRQ